MSTVTANLPNVKDPRFAPFWEASAQHVLVAQKCDDCGYLRFPPLEICPKCWSENQSWTEISTEGTVWSYVVYHRALDASKADEIPYVVGRVVTDDGPIFTVRLNVAPAEAKVDLRVSATWDDVSDEVTLLRFAPSGA